MNERVTKIEEENANAAKAEEVQEEKIAEMERSWQEKMTAAEEAFKMQLDALEKDSAEKHAAQQQVIDQLVTIMSRFDVSGDLERLRQTNEQNNEASN